MITMIAERPIMVAIALLVIGLAVLFAWLQSGRRELLITAAVVLVLIPMEFVVAAKWKTDREAIREMIHETASLVERNDFDGAIEVIADEKYRRMASMELPRFQFSEARMTGERSITVDPSGGTTTAEADINVRVKVAAGGMGEMTIPRRLVLDLEKFDDDWMVVGYRHLPVVGGPDGYSQQLR